MENMPFHQLTLRTNTCKTEPRHGWAYVFLATLVARAGPFALLCGLLAANLAFGQADLQILRATYGDGNTVRDVTASVASKIQNSTLRIQAAPDALGGDPVPGSVKTLWVQYNDRGQTGENLHNPLKPRAGQTSV